VEIYSPPDHFMPVNPASTSPYAEFQAELQQIMRHKWFVSEKEGKDVGFERALTDWVKSHRHEWRCERNQAGAEPENLSKGLI
jgi:hypothetical protein